MTPSARPLARTVATVVAVVAIALLAGCAPDPADAPATSSSSGTPTPTDSPTPEASPTPSATPVSLPTDCRAILTEAVLAQLDGVPLNDPAFTGTGVQPDGTLVCTWGRPDTDTGRLQTTISSMSRGPALDMLNGLAAEGYSCYTPTGGTRCEKVWINEQYPVNDGRTLFWRQDVMIDTQYTDLAPAGYTDAVIAGVFG
ncbi:hypothetical protein AB0N73_11150 [Microbacterium sp. NPDC089189]|uniref:hypothetical protein n=1 Tax=Microbacterium sp. NPDC089189 TaxID=3154972 RepID=UPI0034253454